MCIYPGNSETDLQLKHYFFIILNLVHDDKELRGLDCGQELHVMKLPLPPKKDGSLLQRAYNPCMRQQVEIINLFSVRHSVFSI